MDPEPSQRLEQLEAHLMHLEHQVEQLNAVILDQGKGLDRLKVQLRRQAQTLESIELERVKATDSRPPHH